MNNGGIEGLIVETHNWGKAAAFWKALGYEIEFETDHGSGQLKHPKGGPYLFIREIPESETVKIVPVLMTSAPAGFEAPKNGTVIRKFEPQHWGVIEMLLADPDGRTLSIQSALKKEIG